MAPSAHGGKQAAANGGAHVASRGNGDSRGIKLVAYEKKQRNVAIWRHHQHGESNNSVA